MNKKNLRLSRSVVGKEEALAVSRVIEETGYLGMGNEVRLFEEEVAAYLGVPPERVMAVNTGTAALHLAMESALEPGSEVLIPSMTFVASFQAALDAGCVPVPCDIDPTTGLLDLADAARRITPATRARPGWRHFRIPGRGGSTGFILNARSSRASARSRPSPILR